MDELFDKVEVHLAGVMAELERLRDKVPGQDVWAIQALLKEAQDAFRAAKRAHFEFQERRANAEVVLR